MPQVSKKAWMVRPFQENKNKQRKKPKTVSLLAEEKNRCHEEDATECLFCFPIGSSFYPYMACSAGCPAASFSPDYSSSLSSTLANPQDAVVEALSQAHWEGNSRYHGQQALIIFHGSQVRSFRLFRIEQPTYPLVSQSVKNLPTMQGGLACYNSWGCKESDTTEQLN